MGSGHIFPPPLQVSSSSDIDFLFSYSTFLSALIFSFHDFPILFLFCERETLLVPCEKLFCHFNKQIDKNDFKRMICKIWLSLTHIISINYSHNSKCFYLMSLRILSIVSAVGSLVEVLLSNQIKPLIEYLVLECPRFILNPVSRSPPDLSNNQYLRLNSAPQSVGQKSKNCIIHSC